MSEEQFDDPFDPNTTDEQSETKTLPQIMIEHFEDSVKDLHTWLPCKVIQVRSNGVVDVQPLIQRKYKDGTVVKIPPIQNVPVIHLRGKNYGIKLPVAVDDTGIALFCERSLDNWKQSGDFVEPGDIRTHDLSDAVFVPGLYPLDDEDIIEGDPTHLIVRNKETVVILTQDDKMILAANTKISLQHAKDPGTLEKMVMGETLKQFESDFLQKISDLDAKLASVMTELQNQALTLASLATTDSTHDHALDISNNKTLPPNQAAAMAADAATLTSDAAGFASDNADFLSKKADIEALKASPIDDGKILSDLSFTEK